MSERIAAVVREESTRWIGIAVGLAALIAAIAFLMSGLSGPSGAAAKGQAGAGSASLTPAQINANVDRLLGKMTVAEKFGQLEMAGPSTPDRQRSERAGQAGNDRLGARPHRRRQHQRGPRPRSRTRGSTFR